MMAVREGNGINYASYLGINPNSELAKRISDPNVVVAEDEKNNTNHVKSEAETIEDDAPVVDIVINNVVCSFNLRCHLNLKAIALNGCNVEYKRENGMVTMKLRQPNATATIWSSGKIICTGATSNDDSKKAARRIARKIQQLGFRARFTNFRIVNVLGTCTMPFAIKITHFSEANRPIASYEPELHPGVTYKIKEIKATLKIFSTGSITVTAPSIDNVQLAVERIFPLVYEFRKERPPQIVKAIVPPANSRLRQPTPICKADSASEDIDVDHDTDESWD